jgi:hypothetical protein
MALDLASTSGFAIGEPGGTPLSGSVRFASAGASHEAIFAKASQWMNGALVAHVPGTVVWEAPLATSFRKGQSNINTTTLLYGLPAVIGAVAYLKGIYDIRKASTRDVRMHFIGQNPKGHIGKKLVMRQCRAMGWSPIDDNESDALALWHYMCALIEPKLAIAPTPLFGRAVL